MGHVKSFICFCAFSASSWVRTFIPLAILAFFCASGNWIQPPSCIYIWRVAFHYNALLELFIIVLVLIRRYKWHSSTSKHCVIANCPKTLKLLSCADGIFLLQYIRPPYHIGGFEMFSMCNFELLHFPLKNADKHGLNLWLISLKFKVLDSLADSEPQSCFFDDEFHFEIID